MTHKIKIWKVADFGKDKLEVVKMFLHYALDHMKAVNYLKVDKNYMLLDSAAYLCHLAFEILLKAGHLYKFEEYKNVHSLIKLSESIDWFSEKDNELLKIIDRHYSLRYPIDINIDKNKTILEIDGMSSYPGEVGTNELEKAINLFRKIWNKLEDDEDLKSIIKIIKENPYEKGGRTLYKRKKKTKPITTESKT